MAQPGTDPLHDPEARTRRSDPRFTHGPEAGHQRQAREHRRRRGPAWTLLALSAVMLIMGLVLPQGLLLAAGLVTAGMATHLLAPPHDPDRPGLPLHALPRRIPAVITRA